MTLLEEQNATINHLKRERDEANARASVLADTAVNTIIHRTVEVVQADSSDLAAHKRTHPCPRGIRRKCRHCRAIREEQGMSAARFWRRVGPVMPWLVLLCVLIGWATR